ncbi:MAG: tetraprenyl-beta-curcumene synthase family protein [Moorellales bacterium]
MGWYLFGVLPQVARELAHWRRQAGGCPDARLRAMALSSLDQKRFHCQGGSFFALWVSLPYRPWVVRAVVALQTISDYLDNLCDRLGVEDERAFRRLHRSLVDALLPGESLKDYYSAYPYRADGGYLLMLVRCCQQSLSRLPGWPTVREEALRMAGWYADLQATKHLGVGEREDRVRSWLAGVEGQIRSGLAWWELAAATGSTLGIFGLMALATRWSLGREEVALFLEAYFPWVCALHILLDYLIDQHEDRLGGDLNFVSYYRHPGEVVERLLFLARQAGQRVAKLPDPRFHRTLVMGLLSLYLSDPKVDQQGLMDLRRELLAAAGTDAWRLYRLCRAVRCLGL